MGTRGTVTIICGGKTCTMWNRYDSYHSGLGLDLIKELREIILRLEDWKNRWNKIEIIDRETDQLNDFVFNEYPGSLQAVIESLSLSHSDYNDSQIDYIINFDDGTFSCDNNEYDFNELKLLQECYELEASLEADD